MTSRQVIGNTPRVAFADVKKFPVASTGLETTESPTPRVEATIDTSDNQELLSEMMGHHVPVRFSWRNVFDHNADIAFQEARIDELQEFTFPAELRPFVEEIVRSSYLLNLQNDWDGEGAPRLSRSTWHRALSLLIELATDYWEERGDSLPSPSIQPGIEGDLDLYWTVRDRKILINVPDEDEDLATVFGRDLKRSQLSVQGAFDTNDSNRWLVNWLTS